MTGFDRFCDRLTRTTPGSAAMMLGLGLVPGLNFLSGALLGLVLLVRGYFSAALAGGAAAVGLVAIAWAIGAGPIAMLTEPFGWTLFAIWVPIFVLAAVLRSSRSLALMLVIAALVASLVVVGQLLLIADPLLFWQHLLEQALAPIHAVEGQSEAVWQESVENMARLMPGVSAAGLLISAVAMVCLSRFVQARLARPGAFGEEFRGLNLGRVVTVIGSLVLVARLIYAVPMLENLAIVMLAMFAFQGLAIIHFLFRSRRWPHWPLVLIYALIALFPLWLAGPIAGAGLVDNWFDFRRLRHPPPASKQ
ncbi:MAG: YybS family protein [Gammaproteobacteria bacterium]|nr:YybS family protein [Gammaproteobacteria bacterium]